MSNDAVHKPTATIKNILCSKAKDRLDLMDKSGAVYHIKCEKHHADYENKDTGMASVFWESDENKQL